MRSRLSVPLLMAAGGLLATAAVHADTTAHFELALSTDGLGKDNAACAAESADARVRCLIAQRYTGTARELALRLYADHGNVAGVERAQVIDGGFRGRIQLVPAWPSGADLRHLAAIVRAHDVIERTLAGIRAHASQPVHYRHRGLVYRFFRSVGRTTPSAYAGEWTIGYNLAGSLHRDDEAILGTLIHEIFHLNDQERRFSGDALRAIHASILKRCSGELRATRRCFAPFSPTATTVRGGTYYAFQPNNGDAVNEYAAELATRYMLEHRALLEQGRLKARAFKCLSAENAESYRKVAEAFFAGVDLTTCAN